MRIFRTFQMIESRGSFEGIETPRLIFSLYYTFEGDMMSSEPNVSVHEVVGRIIRLLLE